LLLRDSSNVDEMIKYLSEKYSLRCVIKNYPKPNYLQTHKKNIAELAIHEDVVLNDLYSLLKDYNIDVDFVNLNNHKIPKNILLKDVGNYLPEAKETNEVFKSLKIISSMRDSHIYTDIDWIIRIYKRIINIASTIEEKNKILDSMIKLKKSNERFTERDLKELEELIKK
tara:strand:+ start:894 stop:1403 length:510 start_codon:yes stop_codon:yes gene_type:complete